MKLTRIPRIACAIVLVGVVWITTSAAFAQPQSDFDKRVESILSRMTLEEKITYIGGINDFFIRPMPRVGIPELKMSDGPMGVHDYGPTTARETCSEPDLAPGTITRRISRRRDRP